MAEWILEDEFGDVVGKARRGLGLSVDQLAVAAGLPAETVAAFEGYRRDPDREQSRALAVSLGLRPDQLWELAEEAWLPEPPSPDLGGGVRVDSLYLPTDRVWTYLLGDLDACLAIDCGAGLADIEAAIGDRELLAIVLTHADADHIYSLSGLLANRQIPVFVHETERDRVVADDVRCFVDGDLLTLGRFQLSVLHAPGHSPGCCGLHVPGAVFTGDTVFAASLGGTRMGPEHYAGHLAAVRSKILALPGSTKLFHGHGAHSTVAEELDHNSFFDAAS